MTELHGGMSGHMLQGVAMVAVIGDCVTREVVEFESDGRAFMWENGAVTVYSPNPKKGWMIFPAHRIVSIVGKEHG